MISWYSQHGEKKCHCIPGQSLPAWHSFTLFGDKMLLLALIFATALMWMSHSCSSFPPTSFVPPSDIHGLVLWTNSKCSAINPASSRATLTPSAAQRCSPCWQHWAYNSILHCPHKCSSIRWADYQHFLFSWKVLCVLRYLRTITVGFKVVSIFLTTCVILDVIY